MGIELTSVVDVSALKAAEVRRARRRAIKFVRQEGFRMYAADPLSGSRYSAPTGHPWEQGETAYISGPIVEEKWHAVRRVTTIVEHFRHRGTGEVRRLIRATTEGWERRPDALSWVDVCGWCGASAGRDGWDCLNCGGN